MQRFIRLKTPLSQRIVFLISIRGKISSDVDPVQGERLFFIPNSRKSMIGVPCPHSYIWAFRNTARCISIIISEP